MRFFYASTWKVLIFFFIFLQHVPLGALWFCMQDVSGGQQVYLSHEPLSFYFLYISYPKYNIGANVKVTPNA